MSIMDSLTQVMDTVSNVTQPIATNTSTNGSYQWAYWVGAALATCVIALGLLKKKNSEQDVLKKKMKEGDIDFGNVINSAFYSKELYDILKKKCHPDRFAGKNLRIHQRHVIVVHKVKESGILKRHVIAMRKRQFGCPEAGQPDTDFLDV